MRPTRAKIAELRRMLAELDALQYTARTFAPIEYGPGHFDISAGCGNAPVYQDIVSGYSPIPAASLRRLLSNHIAGGRQTVWYARALRVARLRLEGSYEVSKPILPPDAGLTPRQQARIAREADQREYAGFAAEVDRPAAEETRYYYGEA